LAYLILQIKGHGEISIILVEEFTTILSRPDATLVHGVVRLVLT